MTTGKEYATGIGFYFHKDPFGESDVQELVGTLIAKAYDAGYNAGAKVEQKPILESVPMGDCGRSQAYQDGFKKGYETVSRRCRDCSTVGRECETCVDGNHFFKKWADGEVTQRSCLDVPEDDDRYQCDGYCQDCPEVENEPVDEEGEYDRD